MNRKPLVFISHISEEKDLAILIKDELIESNLLGSVDVFVSSDTRVNTGGQSWLKNIEDALQRAAVFLILTSPSSVLRPWINIEAGAGWLRQLQACTSGGDPVFVMPLCHSGQRVSELPKPWDTLNAVECNTVPGLQEVLNIIGRVAKLTKIPKPSFDNPLQKIADLEQRYTYFSRIESAVISILAVFPNYKPVFLGQVPLGQMRVFTDLPKHEVDDLYRSRTYLEKEGLLISQLGGSKQVVGGPKPGTWTDLGLNVTQKYIDDVLGKITLP